MVPLYKLVQKGSDPCHRSRVIAANNIINAFFMVVSIVSMIVLISVEIMIPVVFLIVAITNLFVMMFVFNKELEFLAQFTKCVNSLMR